MSSAGLHRPVAGPSRGDAAARTERQVTPEQSEDFRNQLGYRAGHGLSSSPRSARRSGRSGRVARQSSASPTRTASPDVQAPFTPARSGRAFQSGTARRRLLFEDDMDEERSVPFVMLSTDWRRSRSNAMAKRAFSPASDSEPDSPVSKRSRREESVESIEEDEDSTSRSLRFAPATHFHRRNSASLSLAGQMPARPRLLRDSTSVSPPEFTPEGPLYSADRTLPVPIPRAAPIRFSVPNRQSRISREQISSARTPISESPGQRMVSNGVEREQSLRPAREALVGPSSQLFPPLDPQLFAPLDPPPATSTHRFGALGIGRMRGPTASSNERWLHRGNQEESSTSRSRWSRAAQSSGDVEGLPMFLRDEVDSQPLASRIDSVSPGHLRRASMDLTRRREEAQSDMSEVRRTAVDFAERLANVRRERRELASRFYENSDDLLGEEDTPVQSSWLSRQAPFAPRSFEIFRRPATGSEARDWAAPFLPDDPDFDDVLGLHLGDWAIGEDTDYETLYALTNALGPVVPRHTTKWAIDETERRFPDRMPVVDAEKAHLLTNCNSANQCLICLEKYAIDTQVRVLPCRHAFDVDCIDKWLTDRSGANSCPVCRQTVISDDIAIQARGVATV